MSERPTAHLGVRHVALYVEDLPAVQRFYVDLLGYEVEWAPDEDNLYLTSGTDNLALHHATAPPGGQQRLDHIGIIVQRAELVDEWFEFLSHHDVVIEAAPKTHRDGARSMYCRDPAGTLVQIIHHPPISQPPA